ncbi:MAG: LysM peptidoglycan-binding domain-containing protein [Gemmatimonadota bacterium]|nr:LysM peptidoglycan-binding domain-containing protein [Gemmatimonadota bacterium]
MSHRSLSLAAVLVVFAACAPSRPRGLEPAPVPAEAPDTLDLGPQLEEKDLRASATRDLLGKVRYDLPMEANTWVEAELDFLVNQRKAVVGRWLERAERYEEFVKQTFAAHGLPSDLHHLAMVESGYLPRARSHAGAVGMWQFMPATGRDMGLRIDSLVDERMDPVRSTHAAARHLKYLHRAFGNDWSLAAAAYNAGTGRISRGMRDVRARNFWELAVWGTLAQETKQYVPRLYAVTIIARDRARFGFPAPTGTARPFAYDSIRTDLSIPLSELAALGSVSASALAELNPHLVRGTTPAGSYWVWVPRGTGPAVQQAYLGSQFRRDGGYGSYAVRTGDTVEKLASVAGVEVERFRELNASLDLQKLTPGTRLRLPKRAAETLSARPVERLASRESERKKKREERKEEDSEKKKAKGDRAARSGDSDQSGKKKSDRFAEHVVQVGETLWQIARANDMKVEDLQKANDLSGGTIVPGQTLRIPLASIASAKKKPEEKKPEEKKPEEKKSGEKKREEKKESGRYADYVVKNGDTLWGIARAHDSTVVAIRAANGMSDKADIRPGQTLRIPRGAK